MEEEAFLGEDTDMTLCRSWVFFWVSWELSETRTEAVKTFEKPSEECLAAGATPPRNGPAQGYSRMRLGSDRFLDIVPLGRTERMWPPGVGFFEGGFLVWL